MDRNAGVKNHNYEHELRECMHRGYMPNYYRNTLCIADLWSDVLKPDFLSTLCIRIAKLYIIQKYNIL